MHFRLKKSLDQGFKQDDGRSQHLQHHLHKQNKHITNTMRKLFEQTSPLLDTG